MFKKGFDNEKYLTMQSEHIKEKNCPVWKQAIFGVWWKVI